MIERLTTDQSGARTARRMLAVAGTGALAALFAMPALAYVGPGAGLGVLGALFAILLAVLATVVGLVLWPLRAITRRWKSRRSAAEGTGAGNPPG